MKAEIRTFPGKSLTGLKKQMSYADNKTFELWSSFMPRRKELKSGIGEDLYSVQNFPKGFYEQFEFDRIFEKWACIEASETEEIPKGMERIQIPEGKYAVFIFKGTNDQASEFFKSIFYQWLPQSDYILDLRPHFEILGKNYKKNDPNSEEEVWIPIKDK